MKYLLILLFGLSAFADVGYINPNLPNTVYYDGKCPGECYAFHPGDDMEVLSVKDVEEDDLERPILEAPSKEMFGLQNQKECFDLVDGTLEWCSAPHFKMCEKETRGTWKAYCTRYLGYEKKIVKKLLPDPAKIAAKEAKKIQENQAKENKKNAIRNANTVNALKAALIDYLGL